MAWFDRFVHWFMASAPAAGATAPLREAFGTTIDRDEEQWRRLSGDTQRDLGPMRQERMQKVAAYLWESNPLANRLIELPTAYLLGEGVRLQVRDEAAQKVLREFWNDPINAMDLRLEAMVREAELYGEQCYPAFVNEMTGRVRLGYLDPMLIETVVVDPDNPAQPIGIVTVKDSKGKARRYRVIVGAGSEEDERELFTKRTAAIRETFADGACFFFRCNHLLGGRRGRSAMLAQMDWLDGYDEFLFGELDRARDLRSFVWDVTLKNATQAEVEERAGKIAAPAPRSVRVHNDMEEWKPLAPGLSAADNDTTARIFRNHVLGGATIPEHWFGSGGDVNRATAGEMGEPTLKVLTQKQKSWKHVLELMGRFVLAQAAAAGRLEQYDPQNEDFAVQAVFPELTARDTTKYASALQQVVASSVMAIERGLLTELTAVKIIVSVAGRLGVEFDADAELEAARAEAKARRAQRDADYGAPDLDAAADEAAVTIARERAARPPARDAAAAGDAAE